VTDVILLSYIFFTFRQHK